MPAIIKFSILCVVFAVCTFELCSSGEYIYSSDCPPIKPIKRIHADQLEGLFYGIYTTQIGLACLKFNRTFTRHKHYNVSLNAISAEGKPVMMFLQTKFRQAEKPDAQYQAIYSGFPTLPNEFFLAIDYSTDDGYEITYSCSKNQNTKTEMLLVGSRKMQMCSGVLEKVLSKNNLSHLQLAGPATLKDCPNWKL